MSQTANLLVMAAIGITAGGAILLAPQQFATWTHNQFWLRSRLRRSYLRICGVGFIAFGIFAIACLLFPSIFPFPGD